MMIIKGKIEWHIEEIPYQDFDDGQEVILWVSKYNLANNMF
jgi:hypothetical protein